MNRILVSVTTSLLIVFTQSSFAESGAKEDKPTGHCEKTTADGSTADVEAKDKKDCKAKGGKWNKASKGAVEADGKELIVLRHHAEKIAAGAQAIQPHRNPEQHQLGFHGSPRVRSGQPSAFSG